MELSGIYLASGASQSDPEKTDGRTDRAAFDGKLEFDVKLISYKGSDAWIEEALLKIKKTLESDSIPQSGEDCDYCRYIEAANETDAYIN